MHTESRLYRRIQYGQAAHGIRFRRGNARPIGVARTIVAIENQCTPDRTAVVRSVCKSFRLLL
ncbi:hypothetical protein EGO51_02120 [Haloarcula hispanica]|uniref:Uncharacterized protein n=1 Tax=Haloarcula hispanica TaxID=51589 RepID=A0A482T3C4_HALHI|nr:hypothetical protein Har1131_01185 [Haloarcula sp. CBA1131]KAA9408625.1 hypothetical protein EGO51_02120 [Haloarcula hispanica]MUV50896.1 hypothetical protein [Haloarcula sp. CBA1122]RYJ10988.1 hypothetical protein ELS20_14055 [Haloarcula hispanica]